MLIQFKYRKFVMHEFSWLLENIDFKSCTSWSRRSFLFLQIPLGSNVIDIFSWKGNMYSRKFIYCQAVSTEKRWEMRIYFISSLPTGEAHFFDSLLQQIMYYIFTIASMSQQSACLISLWFWKRSPRKSKASMQPSQTLSDVWLRATFWQTRRFVKP